MSMGDTMSVNRNRGVAIDGDTGKAGINDWHNAISFLSRGHHLSQRGRFVDAEACYRQAIEIEPDSALAHNNLGWTRQMQASPAEALAGYRRALQLDPGLRIARRNLATLLIRLGQPDESFPVFYDEMLADADSPSWMSGLVTRAMAEHDLTQAGDFAAVLAGLRWGSPLYPPRKPGRMPDIPVRSPEVFLSVGKLRHDIEQFLYLQEKGVLDDWFTAIIKDYQDALDRLAARGQGGRVPIDGETLRTIGHVYSRIVHIRHTPRTKRALSDTWDAPDIESQYLDKPPGVVVVDDFLSRETLESLRLFCLESTVWSANRYTHGRLGAFFHDGFNCPLLLQIAEELRETLPRVIGNRYPLRQLWGYKNGHSVPANSSTHADFAAVNVNFWITPDEANLDDTCGGLVVYGVDAPLNWDFSTYNGRPDVINAFLDRQRASAITIPYRQNRAIIFNSDLFHGTQELKFCEGYENRRINITMLYGDRENDVHHVRLARRDLADDSNFAAWRSGAFTRVRRGTR